MYNPNTITNIGSKAKPEVTYPVNQNRPLARFLYYTQASITRKKVTHLSEHLVLSFIKTNECVSAGRTFRLCQMSLKWRLVFKEPLYNGHIVPQFVFTVYTSCLTLCFFVFSFLILRHLKLNIFFLPFNIELCVTLNCACPIILIELNDTSFFY